MFSPSRLAFLIFVAFLMTGCLEKNTDEPTKAYRYWSGQNPPTNIQVLNGHYWESAHWTKEYFLYLEMIASKEWISEYKSQNGLKAFEGDVLLYSDKPVWFKPTNKFKVYTPNGVHSGTFLYEDSASGHIFIMESIL